MTQKNKTALITGITGQDGAYLAELLLEKGYTVHGIKRRASLFNTDRIDHLYQDPHEENQRLILHYGDMTDSLNLTRIIQETQPDEIYNLAAQSHVQVSFDTPEYTANVSNGRVVKADNPFIREHQLEGKFIVQYSGNIGLSHRVEWLIELAEELQKHDHILIQIIGRGPRKPVLERLVAEKNLANCQFLPFQSDEMFPYSLSAADVGVVMLDPRISQGSVPSKTYNLMAYGIPALYVASPDSELARYTDKYEHGLCVEEQQIMEAAEFLIKLSRNSEEYTVP